MSRCADARVDRSAASAAAPATRSRRRRRCGSTSGGSTGCSRRLGPRRRTSPSAENVANGAPAGSCPSPASRPRLEGRDEEGVVAVSAARAAAGRRGASRRGRGSRRAPPASRGSTAAMSVGDELDVARRPRRAVDVDVRPGPELVGGREGGEVGDRRRTAAALGRERTWRDSGRTRPRLEHHERDPRPQPQPARRPAPPACSARGSPRRRTRSRRGSWARSW